MKFFLPMAPVAKGRPRFTRNGHTYTPTKTKVAMLHTRLLAARHAPLEAPGGAVNVAIEFVMPKPKSYPRCLYGAPHVKKPDVDNLGKLILDSLGKGLFWVDDSQVDELDLAKRYQREGETVGIWIEIQGSEA